MAFSALILSIVMAAILSFVDGAFAVYGWPSYGPFRSWASDFRYLFEQGILVSAVLYVGLKILETRTVLSIGFDKVDAGRMSVKGPDENNIVWIGRRYDSAFEAEAVAEAMKYRLDDK